MKKILIVDCNAKLGGIQKALISFLQQQHTENDISVLFFYKAGSLLSEIPENVKVYTTESDFKYMGMSQADCTTIKDKIKRALYVAISRWFGQETAVRIAKLSLRDRISESFDEVISFSHMADERSFYGGTPQYVLNLKNTKKKTCYIHCDYLHSGNRSLYSDAVYSKFDEIICVSESTKNIFLEALPQLHEKVVAKYNYIDGEKIRRLAQAEPYIYDEEYINAIVVARLTKEKGIPRIVRIFESLNRDIKIRLYIIGDGKEKNDIVEIIKTANLKNKVILLGEQENPYRYMLNADFLIVPSYHEAAPIIYQEAIELNLMVLTTRTTSADEMIGESHGLVVDNNDEALRDGMFKIISAPHEWINRFRKK